MRRWRASRFLRLEEVPDAAGVTQTSPSNIRIIERREYFRFSPEARLRAEVTDATMSTRSECVMLTKGAHIGEAIQFLTDVSQRMSRHTEKTLAMHRRLSVAASEWLAVDRAAHSAG